GIRTAYTSSEIDNVACEIDRKPDSRPRPLPSQTGGGLMTGNADATAPTCTCLPPWPALTAAIAGTTYTVVPAPAHTPASALYLARYPGCGASTPAPGGASRSLHTPPDDTAPRHRRLLRTAARHAAQSMTASVRRRCTGRHPPDGGRARVRWRSLNRYDPKATSRPSAVGSKAQRAGWRMPITTT
ncbi:hypothetical protein ABT173_49125, partial [Streptomyces sp. NPDC001795]|uniref:hypothetical protein n=1 Tax=Streptomyces sp. NPDC001795 TaxID=3154525 RepID=UPI00331F3006